MNNLRFGVQLPKALVKKPAPMGHNNNEGEKRIPKCTTVDRKNNTMQTLSNNVSENPAINPAINPASAPEQQTAAREPVVVDAPAPVLQQVVNLQDVLTAGIAVKVDAPKKTLVDHAVDASKGALAVAGGIGLAAGAYAVGKWVASFFGEEAAE